MSTKYFVVFFVTSALVTSLLANSERITHFDSTITVQPDTWVVVHESIDFYADHEQIKHGILRVLPMRYAGGTTVYYRIVSATMDAQPTLYKTKEFDGKLHIYMGSKETLLPSGPHHAEIIYKTAHQLGFFDDHDEFAWNVTGGWPFAIESTTAKLHLPANIPATAIKLQAYTGYYGETGTNYSSAIKDGVCVFSMTQPLAPRQNITIVAAWPKGYIQKPGFVQKIIFYVKFFPSIVIWLLGLLVMLALFIACKISRARAHMSVIIPRFAPPQNLLPGTLRYVIRRSYDQQAFTADLVNMGVHGFITIEPIQKILSKNFIVKKAAESTITPYTLALENLFKTKDTVEMTQDNRETIWDTWKELEKVAQKEKSSIFLSYTGYNTLILGAALVFGLATALCAQTIDAISPTGDFWTVIIVASYILFLVLLFTAMQTYTPAGLNLVDEINGFKLFLSATEKDRIAMLSAPDRSPKQYERFLPYAIALGVEKQWTQQFKSVLDKLTPAERQHLFLWYNGAFSPIIATSLGSDLCPNISSGFMQSSSAPGSRSSFGGGGGGGSSGSGGGGGGGGGW